MSFSSAGSLPDSLAIGVHDLKRRELLETLLANPEIGAEMGRRGKLRAENEFRFNVFSKALKKILRDLCES